MQVCKNPLKRPNGNPLIVFHPDNGQPFPDGPFELSEADQGNPRILRLFPREVPGGIFGDLVHLPLTAEQKNAVRANDAEDAAKLAVADMETKTDTQRDADRIKAVTQAFGSLTDGDYDAKGVPTVKAVERVLGFDVTDAEVEYAWQQHQDAGKTEKKNAKK